LIFKVGDLFAHDIITTKEHDDIIRRIDKDIALEYLQEEKSNGDD
jgi:hypothetical protein